MNSDEQNILKGKTIIKTFPGNEPDELTEVLTNAGAHVLSMPMISIEPVPFSLKKDMNHYNWLVFTSKNAISPFFNQYTAIISQKIAALGPGTATALIQLGYKVNFTGKRKSAVHFTEELRQIILPGENILLILGTLASDILETGLSDIYTVERVNVYQTVMPKQMDHDLLEHVEEDLYDILLVSSPSAFRNLFSVLSCNKENLRIISIGETTTAAIREFNIEPVATAANPGYKGLAEATINYFINERFK
jgi:uroporphyrinogen-III synthase